MWRLQETSIKNEYEAQFRTKSFTMDKSGVLKAFESHLRLIFWNQVILFVAGQKNRSNIVTWWKNDTVDAAVKEKRAAWKFWHNFASKNEYLRVKKAAKRAVYDARRVAEQVRFGEVLKRENNRKV